MKVKFFPKRKTVFNDHFTLLFPVSLFYFLLFFFAYGLLYRDLLTRTNGFSCANLEDNHFASSGNLRRLPRGCPTGGEISTNFTYILSLFFFFSQPQILYTKALWL